MVSQVWLRRLTTHCSAVGVGLLATLFSAVPASAGTAATPNVGAVRETGDIQIFPVGMMIWIAIGFVVVVVGLFASGRVSRQAVTVEARSTLGNLDTLQNG